MYPSTVLLELEICNEKKFPFPLQAPVFHAWGENYCTNFDSAFNKKASSVRYKFVFSAKLHLSHFKITMEAV